jgi:hypothetical protein
VRAWLAGGWHGADAYALGLAVRVLVVGCHADAPLRAA